MTRNALKLLTGSNLFLGVPGQENASQLEKWNLHMLSQNHNINEYLRHLLKVKNKWIGSGPDFSSFFHPQPAPELARFGGTMWPILAVIKWEAWRLGEFWPWKPESKRRAWYCKRVQHHLYHILPFWYILLLGESMSHESRLCLSCTTSSVSCVEG